jgi:hypothetical protein
MSENTTSSTPLGIHLKNSLFHVLTVMVGTRNTPDEAYRVLYFELEDRKRAYDGAMASRKRNLAKKGRLEARMSLGLNSDGSAMDQFDRLELEADLDELNSGTQTMENAVSGCEFEMKFITDLMEKLLEQCEYVGKMDITEAFTRCHRKEWALEHRKRAENFLLTQGSIPTDYFEVMRVHPDFDEHIAPLIEDTRMALVQNRTGLHAINVQTPTFLKTIQESFPALLMPGATNDAPLALSPASPVSPLSLGTGQMQAVLTGGEMSPTLGG